MDGTASLFQEKLIGRIIISWSKLEALIDHAIWCFMNLDLDNGQKFTTPMNADRKIVLFRLLAETYLDSDQLKTILNTIETIDLCKEDRNFVAHGIWSRLQPENVPVVSSIRVKTNPDKVIAEPFPDTRLLKLIVEIETARGVLSNLIKRLDSWTPRKIFA